MITTEHLDAQKGNISCDLFQMSVMEGDSDVSQTIDQHFQDCVASPAHTFASAHDRDDVANILHDFNCRAELDRASHTVKLFLLGCGENCSGAIIVSFVHVGNVFYQAP
jgi:hypothetical protein